MNEPMTAKRNRIRCHTPGFSHSPQKCGGHGFARAFGVRLFVNDLQVLGVNTDKQLRSSFAGKAGLDIYDDSTIQDLTVRSVMKFAIRPHPKCRSAMRHFRRTPCLREIVDRKNRSCRYLHSIGTSMDSYKRYRCNVLVGLYSCRDATRVADADQRGLANDEAIASVIERFVNEDAGKFYGRADALVAELAAITGGGA